jgi:hypothetical protein
VVGFKNADRKELLRSHVIWNSNHMFKVDDPFDRPMANS